MSESAEALGALVAAGPRAAAAPAEYARLVAEIRQGYLLHYRPAQPASPADLDLALLTGDHLYALGLERLGKLGDLESVVELADLISLCAQIHAGSENRAGRVLESEPRRAHTFSYVSEGRGRRARDATVCRSLSDALWLSTAVAVGVGPHESHDAAKDALREGAENALDLLWSSARSRAAAAGLAEPLEQAAAQVGFRARG